MSEARSIVRENPKTVLTGLHDFFFILCLFPKLDATSSLLSLSSRSLRTRLPTTEVTMRRNLKNVEGKELTSAKTCLAKNKQS